MFGVVRETGLHGPLTTTWGGRKTLDIKGIRGYEGGPVVREGTGRLGRSRDQRDDWTPGPFARSDLLSHPHLRDLPSKDEKTQGVNSVPPHPQGPLTPTLPFPMGLQSEFLFFSDVGTTRR